VVVAEPSRVALPEVTELEPLVAPDPLVLGTTVTLKGAGFGDEAGYVYFGDALTCALAGPDPPAHCSTPASVVTWSDTEVVVDVPLSCRGDVSVTLLAGHLALSAPARYRCPPEQP